MPVILTQNLANIKTQSLGLVSGKYKYRYPRGNNLRPGTPLHNLVRDEVLARAQLSRDAMQNRFASWRKLDESLTAYIDLTTEEEKLQAQDPNKPVSIVVPVSYATLEVLLTYLSAAFLEEPIFRYEGVSDEDRIGAMLLELLISIQTRKGKAGVQLHTAFRDMFVYGFGAVTPVWTQKRGFRRVRKPRGFVSGFLNKFVVTGETSERREVMIYEGNELQTIDPYHFLPDPYTPLHDIQKSEFVGWVNRTTANTLINRETYDNTHFNCKYLKHIDGKSVLGVDESYRDRYAVQPEAGIGTSTLAPVDVVYMYMTIVPKDMKTDDGQALGTATYPEKWMFGIAGDSIVVAAEPTNYDHNLYPVGVGICDYDGHSIAPISRLEMTYGMQHLINFLFNSHVTNVRKAINDMFVVDPLMINVPDLLSPKPGKVIRTRKKAWGRGVQNLVEQLKVTDVTRGHMSDIVQALDIFDKVTGAVDPLKGQMRGGSERRTAEEFRGTRGAALSRLERAAKITSLQLMQDLGVILASQTQQFMSEDMYVRIAGEYEQDLLEQFGKQYVPVSPFDIMIDYDIKVHDGTLPTDGDPALWASMFQVIGSNDMLMQEFDMVRIFKYWARLSGAKNLNDFILKGGKPQANVMPDEDIEKNVQQGNMVSMEERIASGS